MTKQKQEEINIKSEIIKRSIEDDQTAVAVQWGKTLQYNAPEDPATNIAKLLLACVAQGDFKTSSALTKDEGLTNPSDTLTAVDYLSHASRVVIDYKGLSEENLKEFLSIFPNAGEGGVFSRSATHGVVRNGDKVKELKGFMLGLVGQLPELVKYAYDFGVNIAMGGEGQENYVGKKVTKNGFSGHMYFHHYFPDQLMMVGLEQSAPAGSILEAVMGHGEDDHDAQSHSDQFGQGHSLTGASDTFTAAGSLYFSDPVYQAKLLCETGTTPPDKYGAMQVTLTDENWKLVKKYLEDLNKNLSEKAYDQVFKKLVKPPSTATSEPQVVKSYIALDFKTYLKNIRPLLLEADESVQTNLISVQGKLESKLLSCIDSLRVGYSTQAYKEFLETIEEMNDVEGTPTEYIKALLRIKHLFNLQCKIDPKLEQTRTEVLVKQNCDEIIESVQKLKERATVLKNYYSSLSDTEVPVKLLNEVLSRLKKINDAVTMEVIIEELSLESSLLLQDEMENTWLKLDTFSLEDLLGYQKSLQEMEVFLQEASSLVPTSVLKSTLK